MNRCRTEEECPLLVQLTRGIPMLYPLIKMPQLRITSLNYNATNDISAFWTFTVLRCGYPFHGYVEINEANPFSAYSHRNWVSPLRMLCHLDLSV